MLYRVGRVLQLVGMIILPMAIAGELAKTLDLRESLTVSSIGVMIFFVGWLVQRGGQTK
jgi:hypothetical protein